MAAALMIFGDSIVSATTLNRQSGSVLDRALRGPVTIMRNDEAFALVSRDLAARLVADYEHASKLVELLQAACDKLHGGSSPRPTDAFEWISVFDEHDLLEMTEEVLGAFYRARSGERSWDEFDALLHEWEESAWAARSPDLREAMRSASAEVPLTRPPVPPSED